MRQLVSVGRPQSPLFWDGDAKQIGWDLKAPLQYPNRASCSDQELRQLGKPNELLRREISWPACPLRIRSTIARRKEGKPQHAGEVGSIDPICRS